MAVQTRKGRPALAAPTPEAGGILLGSDVFHLEFVGLIIKSGSRWRPAARRPPETAAKIMVSGVFRPLRPFSFRHRKMHRHMRQAADRGQCPARNTGQGQETMRTRASVVKQAGKRIGGGQDGALGIQDYTGADQDSRRHRGTGKGSRQDDSKDSALGIQDCAGGAERDSRRRRETGEAANGNGARAKYGAAAPLPRGGIRYDGPKKKERGGRGIARGVRGRGLGRGDLRVGSSGIHGWA